MEKLRTFAETSASRLFIIVSLARIYNTRVKCEKCVRYSRSIAVVVVARFSLSSAEVSLLRRAFLRFIKPLARVCVSFSLSSSTALRHTACVCPWTGSRYYSPAKWPFLPPRDDQSLPPTVITYVYMSILNSESNNILQLLSLDEEFSILKNKNENFPT